MTPVPSARTTRNVTRRLQREHSRLPGGPAPVCQGPRSPAGHFSCDPGARPVLPPGLPSTHLIPARSFLSDRGWRRKQGAGEQMVPPSCWSPPPRGGRRQEARHRQTQVTSQAARGEGGASLGPPQPPVGGCHSGRHEGGRPEEARLEPCQRGMVAQEELDDQGQHVPRRRGLAPSPTHTPHPAPRPLRTPQTSAPPVSGSWARDTLYRALRSLQGSPGSVVSARRVFGESP